MTTEVQDVKSVFEYILGKLAIRYSSKAEQLVKLMERGLRGEGWFATEAFMGLTDSLSRQRLTVDAVRGKAQGETTFNPDLEIKIGTQAHQLAIKSMPITGEQDIPYYFSKELPQLFQWMDNLKERAALVVVAYPASINDEAWKNALGAAEEAHQVKAVDQREFLISRPPLPLARAGLALFRHASVA